MLHRVVPVLVKRQLYRYTREEVPGYESITVCIAAPSLSSVQRTLPRISRMHLSAGCVLVRCEYGYPGTVPGYTKLVLCIELNTTVLCTITGTRVLGKYQVSTTTMSTDTHVVVMRQGTITF